MSLWLGAPQGKSSSFKFGGHGHYDSEDIIVLVCYVASQDHVTLSVAARQSKLPFS